MLTKVIKISIILTDCTSERSWVAQISYFINVTTCILVQVCFLNLWALHSQIFLCTSKLHICVVLCVTGYNLELYDMNCYSVNGSHTSQGGIPLGWMSQIKTEHFSFTLVPAPPSMSLLHLYSFVPKRHPVLGTQLLSSQKGGSQAWGGSDASLPPNPGNTCEHEGAVPALTGGPSVSELIRNRPTISSNVDECVMRLAAETWRNMVGGGTFSGLRSMLQKWSLEVLLGHISWRTGGRQKDSPGFKLQKYVDKYK